MKVYFIYTKVISIYVVDLPEKAEVVNGQELCRVCGDVANGVHFGAVTCEGCKVGYTAIFIFPLHCGTKKSWLIV